MTSTPRSQHLSPRLIILATGAACILAGLDAALLRLGLWAPVTGAELAAMHGPLMLVGFLGTVISLERAVAARTSWALLAPLGSSLGCLTILAGAPPLLGRALALAGAVALCLIYLQLHRRAPSVAGDVEALGAVALAFGHVLWLAGTEITEVVPLWLLLPVLTIVGERLELARVAFLDKVVETTVQSLSVAALCAACLLPLVDSARLVLGPALLGLAVVMAWYDVARRTIRGHGAVRFTAASMLAGYLWLAVAGLVWSLTTLSGGASPAYEIVIHCLALGYAFSMILAHAPTIVPAIVHRRLPYHRLMWLPYVLLHVGLAVRVTGLLADSAGTWQAGGVLGVITVLLFLALSLGRTLTAGPITAARPPKASRQATRTVPTSTGVPTEGSTP